MVRQQIHGLTGCDRYSPRASRAARERGDMVITQWRTISFVAKG